ncbi:MULTISPECIES: hypothetical protein [unclassified Paenibacillus]|uniref:hypothetical protein n=1 Tax=unclassified Paenibacillus TaxID=185978 RepID=UPI0029097855|nr:hypothetical protein [Paenibacillus macerans]
MRDVSIRKLLKLPVLFEYDRYELEEELISMKCERKYGFNKCPICGEELYNRSWSEEHWGVVETITLCGRSSEDTHFKDHFSYGYTDLIAGNFEASYNHKTPNDEVERLRAEWLLAATAYKKRCKKNRKLSYRKAKSQQRRMKRA